MESHSGSTDVAQQRRQILGLVTRVERRIRLQRALERATSGAVVFLMAMAVVVVLFKTGWIDSQALSAAGLALATIPVGAALWGWFSSVDRVSVAQRIDQSHGLHDRLSTALSLLDAGKDDQFVRAQIRDAIRHSDGVDTSIAAPFRRPTDLVPFGVFLAAVAVLAFVEPPSHVQPLPEPPHIQHDPVLDAATVAMERERLEEMKADLAKLDEPQAEELLDEIDELLDDVEQRELSEKEFLERIEKIEEQFFDAQRDQAAQELADKLEEAAKELEEEAKADLEDQKELKEAVDALKNQDLEKASQSLEALADKLKNKQLSDEQAEQLAELLEKFADKLDPDDPELQKLAENHKDLVDELSEKFNRDGKLTDEEKKRLDREKEKLSEARKRQAQHSNKPSSRQLKRLQRASKEMAKKLDGQDRPQTGPNQDGQKQDNQDSEQQSQQEAGRMAEEAAREMKDAGQRQREEKVKRMARKQLEEMKESMRRSNNGGEQSGQQGDSQRAEEMREFLRRAQGKEGEESQGEQQAQGQSGSKQGQQAENSNSGEAEKGELPGGKDPGESNQAGQGAGERELGDKTSLDSERQDTKVDGSEAAGKSKSEIIKSASEKGFATTEYKDVYVDYEAVVEEVMEREEVPAGYRYYIKRYFQLIKPRESD